VSAPILGATGPEHLEAAARAVDLELTAEAIQALEPSCQPHPAHGWIQA
jgi:aryl-alcohol dehydrogenase-like predicted oxidoreductase